MFRKINNINLPYDKQALVYYTCKNYNCCDEQVRRKIKYLCEQETELCDELFGMVTSGRSVKSTAIKSHIADRRLTQARKNFYEKWFNGREDWRMPRKSKKDFSTRAEEIMEKTLDRLEACIDDYDTPIPLNQLTSALGTLYEKGCHARNGDEQRERVKVDIKVE